MRSRSVRIRLVLAVALALLTAEGADLALGTVPAIAQNEYVNQDVVREAAERIAERYVDPTTDGKSLTDAAIRGMVASLNDPFTRFLSPEEARAFRTDSSGHSDGIGIALESKTEENSSREEIVISSVLPEGPAAKTGLRCGDTLLKVDTTVVKGRTLTGIVNLIRGDRGTPVLLTVSRKGSDRPIQITVIRASVQVKVVEYRMLDSERKIGYIWLRQFNQGAIDEMRKAIHDLVYKQGAKGLVFDLSMNTGGILDAALEVGSMFTDKGPIAWVKERGHELKPLTAARSDTIEEDVRMVTLIDGGTASGSEIVAGALQDYARSLIVGQASFGVDRVQTIFELQNHSILILSTQVYLTPKMRDISVKDAKGRKGIIPDVTFPERDANSRDLAFGEWHESQIAMAKAELLKLMQKPQ